MTKTESHRGKTVYREDPDIKILIIYIYTIMDVFRKSLLNLSVEDVIAVQVEELILKNPAITSGSAITSLPISNSTGVTVPITSIIYDDEDLVINDFKFGTRNIYE